MDTGTIKSKGGGGSSDSEAGLKVLAWQGGGQLHGRHSAGSEDTGSTGQLLAIVAKTATQLVGLLGPNCGKRLDWFPWRKFKETICSESFSILSVCRDGWERLVWGNDSLDWEPQQPDSLYTCPTD